MDQNTNRNFRNAIILSIIISLFSEFHLDAQSDYPLDINFYEFIHYDKNRFIFPGDSTEFEKFFQKMDSIILLGEGKISIVHIGGSHLQADIYSGRTRQRLQEFYPGMNGGRGFVFPYKMAKTNGPLSYKVSWSGNWETCRNVELKKNCNLGLSGITAITSNPSSEINLSLKQNSDLNYTFDRVRVFHSMGNNSFLPKIDSAIVVRTELDEEHGYTLFYLDKVYEELKLFLNKTDSVQHTFELYGMSLENDDPGIVYHSIGINGASFPSFMRCNLLDKQLQALNPDLVILSLGTNDAYTTKFKPEFYASNYEQMIRRIKNVSPNTAILCTVANDSYLFRRYPNKNTEKASEVIYQVAEKYNCGVWDFYEVMGGFNSSRQWLNENLMGRDLIHFNMEGYLLVGDLLFNAFIKSFDNFNIKQKNQ
jgi:lysophospholipase L1-like esterase